MYNVIVVLNIKYIMNGASALVLDATAKKEMFLILTTDNLERPGPSYINQILQKVA